MRDYDLNAKAVSGLAPGKGKGKFAGMPEGQEGVEPTEDWTMLSVDTEGKIKGNPIGISGAPRSGTIKNDDRTKP